MAACPSMMRMSLSGAKQIDVPVGNSPGPEIIFSSTVGELLIGFPSAFSIVTSNCTSSVPSVRMPVVPDASSFSCAGTPSSGHSGGVIWVYSFLYQYHERLGIRK